MYKRMLMLASNEAKHKHEGKERRAFLLLALEA
jgi:hypothetical protein